MRPPHAAAEHKSQSLLALLGAILLLVSASSLAEFVIYNKTAYLAQATGPSNNSEGRCEKAYSECMKDAIPGHKILGPEYCERAWKSCINVKCRPNINKAEGTLTCPKDADCQATCTEAATSLGGLSTCCEGGPKHNNSCRTKIDGKCTTQIIPKKFVGPTYNEGETIPDREGLTAKELPARPNVIFPDHPYIVSPLWPRNYPKGTVFDEYGMPSNPPDPNPQNPSREFFPSNPEINNPALFDVKPGYSLPPEYRPTPEDVVRMNEMLGLYENSAAPVRSAPHGSVPASPINADHTFLSPNVFVPANFGPVAHHQWQQIVFVPNLTTKHPFTF